MSSPAPLPDAPYSPPAHTLRKGILTGVTAYALWGTLPLYLHPLSGQVPALLILSHRVVWSVLLLTFILTTLKLWHQVVAVFRAPRTLAMLIASTAMICSNWYIFTYVTTHNQILQASLGYFLNPLLSALLGLLFLKERLRPLQWLSISIALAGVLTLAIGLAVLPTTALLLATTFALYGFLRKLAPVDAIAGLSIETALLLPFALLHLAYSATHHTPGGNPTPSLLLYLALGCGLLTTIPLILFSKSAKLLPLSTLGILQYIAPTGQFLCATLAFHESFTKTHALSFSLIWSAVALFLYDTLRRKPATLPESVPTAAPRSLPCTEPV